ncbi:hypothetical protein ACP70R_005092 [Stipagrostis hirtigluma subsp. patula]
MWSCRPFLSRPRALLSGALAPTRRRRLTSPPVLLAAASRGQASHSRHGDRHEDHRTPSTSQQAARQHLYLVLGNVNDTIGIHKVDIDDDDDGDLSGAVDTDTAGSGTPGRLPEPPVMRIEPYPTLGVFPWFAGLGSNIIGIGSGNPRDLRKRDGVTLALDTNTAALTVLRDLPAGLRGGFDEHVAVAVGNRLYVIVYDLEKPRTGGMHCLKLREGANGGGGKDAGDELDPWIWHAAGSSRWFWSDKHCGQKLPLSPGGINCHAVHPAGSAFFVSVCCDEVADHRDHGTFSYDTASGRWTRHGDWELPFEGQAHYDGELGAWVGLHADEDDLEADGFLCSCAVPDLDARDAPAPEWKLCGEQLFLADPARHIDAKLVSMGGGGRFCLVEVLTRGGLTARGLFAIKVREMLNREGCLDGNDKGMIRLTTFRVQRGDDGELTITGRRHAGSYKVPPYYMDSLQAFWM